MTAFSPLSPTEQMRFWSLCVLLKSYRDQLRYVDYAQAEQDAAQLAAILLAQHPRSEIATWQFRGIPRGGLIVLGLLAYQLDLDATQFDPAAAGATVCLVDDCSLTGMRFHQQLQQTAAERIVFAHLYSAPTLRASIVEREPRVIGCYAAHDLRELDAPAGDAAAEDAMDSYLAVYAQRYSHVPVEPIAFAWNEPTTQLRDPFTGEIDALWHFVAPQLALGHLRRLDLPPQPVVRRSLRVPDGIVWAWNDGVLWLLETGSTQVTKLEGFSADAWRALAGYGDVAAALTFLQTRAPEQTGDRLDAQLAQHTAAFLARGVLIAV